MAATPVAHIAATAAGSAQADDGLGDRILGLDGLGVSLVAALGSDQVDQHCGEGDVGLLQGSGPHHPKGATARRTASWVAASTGLGPRGITERLETLLIGEGSQDQLTLGFGLPIGIACDQHTLIVDLQPGQLTGGEAILYYGGDTEARCILGR